MAGAGATSIRAWQPVTIFLPLTVPNDFFGSDTAGVRGDHILLTRALGCKFLWRFGGVFVDAVSLTPLRSIEPLLLGLDAFVANEPDGLASDKIFGAVPHHALVGRMLDNLQSMLAERVDSNKFRASVTSDVAALDATEQFRAFAPHLFFSTDATSPLAYTASRSASSLSGWLSWLSEAASRFAGHDSPRRDYPTTTLRAARRAYGTSISMSCSLTPSQSPTILQILDPALYSGYAPLRDSCARGLAYLHPFGMANGDAVAPKNDDSYVTVSWLGGTPFVYFGIPYNSVFPSTNGVRHDGGERGGGRQSHLTANILPSVGDLCRCTF